MLPILLCTCPQN